MVLYFNRHGCVTQGAGGRSCMAAKRHRSWDCRFVGGPLEHGTLVYHGWEHSTGVFCWSEMTAFVDLHDGEPTPGSWANRPSRFLRHPLFGRRPRSDGAKTRSDFHASKDTLRRIRRSTSNGMPIMFVLGLCAWWELAVDWGRLWLGGKGRLRDKSVSRLCIFGVYIQSYNIIVHRR